MTSCTQKRRWRCRRVERRCCSFCSSSSKISAISLLYLHIINITMHVICRASTDDDVRRRTTMDDDVVRCRTLSHSYAVSLMCDVVRCVNGPLGLSGNLPFDVVLLCLYFLLLANERWVELSLRREKIRRIRSRCGKAWFLNGFIHWAVKTNYTVAAAGLQHLWSKQLCWSLEVHALYGMPF